MARQVDQRPDPWARLQHLPLRGPMGLLHGIRTGCSYSSPRAPGPGWLLLARPLQRPRSAGSSRVVVRGICHTPSISFFLGARV
jgi:hypothetical protein